MDAKIIPFPKQVNKVVSIADVLRSRGVQVIAVPVPDRSPEDVFGPMLPMDDDTPTPA